MNRVHKPASGAPATPSASLETALVQLRQAKTLQDVGAQLRAIAAALPEGGSPETVSSALGTAMQQRPSGVRPFSFSEATGKVAVFLGTATPDGARSRAREEEARSSIAKIEPHVFKTFSTGDPFTFIGVPGDKKQDLPARPADVAKKQVFVFQGDVDSPENASAKFDRATLVAEAVQLVMAARENDAKRITLVLPESLDPSKNPNDRFARLADKLIRDPDIGPDEVIYSKSLDAPAALSDGVTQRSLRPGLSGLGPELKGALAGVRQLEAAQDLGAIGRAIDALGIELLGMSGFSEQTALLTRQVTDTLSAKMKALVPGFGGGLVGQIDDRTVVFAGQSNPALSKDIAATLEAELGQTALHYDGGVPFSTLATPVKDREVVVVQTSREDPSKAQDARNSSMALLAEALLLCDGAKEAGAKDVSLVLPYMPNARSDKKDQDGVGTYAKLVARWVTAIGVDKVVLVEPHDPHVPHYFGTKAVRVVGGNEVLARKAIEDLGREGTVIAYPDDGAKKRTKAMAEKLGFGEEEIVSAQKSRGDNNENAKVDHIDNLEAVKGKRVIVPDDEIATGGTMRQIVSGLKAAGAAEVIVTVPHANMPDTLEARHDSMRAMKKAGADKLYLLDTQPVGVIPPDLADFVKVVSVAGAISDKVF